jgi:hypothetical protein
VRCKYWFDANHRRPLMRNQRCCSGCLFIDTRLSAERLFGVQLEPGYCLERALRLAGVSLGRRGSSAPRCLARTSRGTKCQKRCVKRPDGTFSKRCEKHDGRADWYGPHVRKGRDQLARGWANRARARAERAVRMAAKWAARWEQMGRRWEDWVRRTRRGEAAGRRRFPPDPCCARAAECASAIGGEEARWTGHSGGSRRPYDRFSFSLVER